MAFDFTICRVGLFVLVTVDRDHDELAVRSWNDVFTNQINMSRWCAATRRLPCQAFLGSGMPWKGCQS